MYTLENMPRKFILNVRGKQIEVPDLGLDLTPEEVVKKYQDTYPELVMSVIDGPTIDEKSGVAVYTSTSNPGRKG